VYDRSDPSGLSRVVLIDGAWFRILALDLASNQEEWGMLGSMAVSLKYPAEKDEIGDARLVFERNEDDATRGTWPLPRRDQTCHRYLFARRSRGELSCGENALPAQLVAQMQ